MKEKFIHFVKTKIMSTVSHNQNVHKQIHNEIDKWDDGVKKQELGKISDI